MARPTNQMQDPALLAAALEGLELQRQRLEAQIATVRSMMAGRKAPAVAATVSATKAPKAPKAPKAAKTNRKKRVLSEEARNRIAAAQKKRWAAFRKVK